ncbi:hypothetical protein HBI56_000200 [Parastagonospora nodorum]|uniref:Uncharacterized protein n=1 Tax=Phaeosphaeria nodorum (strain SN15 / ATCC MYA-4574 / FGSC 10173) TaxID=321614 RepID=A0A7U2HXB9_PHANO|nr:hypothetical protein HBH56_140880 [Parastagonospora nodorum]QRC91587.1 hypothetical protein JI435_427150 [Parastagonospora nodorum SN15]KAH3927988.1 hypothetical protein HBH54_146020 [Parastagonospora nodorum]KAH3948969.1 hypothetical protein HBH53_096020 [Parastagonospora nodorum]KAH3972548.1 hypothetical protein HBH52_149230 [Parastagonospora nodorum]
MLSIPSMLYIPAHYTRSFFDSKVGIELSNSRPQTSCIENVREMKREIGVAIQRAEWKHEGGNARRKPLAMQGLRAPRITADATDFSSNRTFVQARKGPIHYMSL